MKALLIWSIPVKPKSTITVSEPHRAARLYAQALKHARLHPNDLETTFAKLQLALSAGSCEAAYAIGSWYANGTHVRKNGKKAHELFIVAAKGRVPEALFNLGYAYEAGKYGRVDKESAYLAYLEAALMGDLDATYEVSRCLWHGIGIGADREAAEVWEHAYVARGGNLEEKDAERMASKG